MNHKRNVSAYFMIKIKRWLGSSADKHRNLQAELSTGVDLGLLNIQYVLHFMKLTESWNIFILNDWGILEFEP